MIFLSPDAAEHLHRDLDGRVLRIAFTTGCGGSGYRLSYADSPIDGDRVMGIFIGSNKNTAAAKCALNMHYAVTKVLRPKAEAKFPSLVKEGFEIDHYQPLLFIVDSFDHLFSLVDQLEKWMREGKLNNVAPGEPTMKEEDLRTAVELLRAALQRYAA